MNPDLEHPSFAKLQLYFDGGLPDFELDAIEDHLADCVDCLAILRRTDALLGSGFSAASHSALIEAEERAADPLVAALRKTVEAFGGELRESIRQWLESSSSAWNFASARAFGFSAAPVPVRDAGVEPLLIELKSTETRARIHVTRSGSTVRVVAASNAALAILFIPGSQAAPLVATFEPVKDVAHAVFENVPEGDYFLAVSPT